MVKLLTTISLVLSLLSFTPAMAAEDKAANTGQAKYYPIEEPFTINFQNQSDNKVRYLQIKVALMSHQDSVINSAELNLPMIQDALRNLFTDQDYQTVSTVAGRQQLQLAALNLVQSLLKEETGRGGLDQVYFTSFILQ